MENKVTTEIIVRFMVGNYYVSSVGMYGLSLHESKKNAHSYTLNPHYSESVLNAILKEVERIKNRSDIDIRIVTETITTETVNEETSARKLTEEIMKELKKKEDNK